MHETRRHSSIIKSSPAMCETRYDLKELQYQKLTPAPTLSKNKALARVDIIAKHSKAQPHESQIRQTTPSLFANMTSAVVIVIVTSRLLPTTIATAQLGEYPLSPPLHELINQRAQVRQHKPTNIKPKELGCVPNAQLQPHMRRRRALKTRIFDLTGDLICKEHVSQKHNFGGEVGPPERSERLQANSPNTCAASNKRASEPMYSLFGPSNVKLLASFLWPRRSTGT